MKQIKVLALLMLTLCMGHISCNANGTTSDSDAVKQAKLKFDEKFVSKGDYFVVKATEGYWLIQFKGVSPTATPRTLTDADTLNGITWRGEVAFGAKLVRDFEGKGDLRPGDWDQTTSKTGQTLFSTLVEQRRGKWTVRTDHLFDGWARPTDADLQRFGAALKKLGETDSSQ